jgi:hypothetical protein
MRTMLAGFLSVPYHAWCIRGGLKKGWCQKENGFGLSSLRLKALAAAAAAAAAAELGLPRAQWVCGKGQQPVCCTLQVKETMASSFGLRCGSSILLYFSVVAAPGWQSSRVYMCSNQPKDCINWLQLFFLRPACASLVTAPLVCSLVLGPRVACTFLCMSICLLV